MCDTQPGIYEKSHLAGILCFTGGGRAKGGRVAHLTGRERKAHRVTESKEGGERHPEEETRDVSEASESSIKTSLTASLKRGIVRGGLTSPSPSHVVGRAKLQP